MSKSIVNKIEEIIINHIEDSIDKKIKANNKIEKEKIRNFIRSELVLLISETFNPFEDIYGNKCIASSITKDHILPQTENGDDKDSNIMMVCEKSNKLKNNLLQGKINGFEWKIIDRMIFANKKEKGTLTIKKNNRWIIISYKKERDRFNKFKEELLNH